MVYAFYRQNYFILIDEIARINAKFETWRQGLGLVGLNLAVVKQII